MIGQVTAVAKVAAGGGLGAEPAGPGATAAAEEYWPGWPTLYAYQREAPPYPV